MISSISKKNADAVYKKSRQRLHILFDLRGLMVNSKILERCYQAYVLSILSFSFMCWFGSLCVKERKRLEGMVSLCGKIVGTNQQTLSNLYNERVRCKAIKIMNDDTHVLSKFFRMLPSGRRLDSYDCKTTRLQKTFIPTAITLYNK